MLYGELFCASYLTIQFTYEVKSGDGFFTSWVCWCLPTIILAIVLGFIFWRLQKLNKKLEGILCNSKLICFHYATFWVAVVSDTVVLVLETIAHHMRINQPAGSTDK